MVQISSSTEVGILTGIVAGVTYFVGAVGASLPPDVAAGLTAVASGITAFLASDNLASSPASTPAKA